jgi:hypothetical protein
LVGYVEEGMNVRLQGFLFAAAFVAVFFGSPD